MKRFLQLTLSLILVLGIGSLEARGAANQGVPYAILQKSEWADAVTYSRKHISQSGTLVQKSDGYVYLKVDDNYIHKLFPKLGLAKKGFRKPPYFRRKDAPGAHISVFYVGEHVKPTEIGKTFRFRIDQIRIVTNPNGEQYAVLEVKAKSLENLRLKYGKSPKLFGHEFHITLAKHY